MERIISNLLELTEKQSKNIELLTTDVETLSGQMDNKPSKRSSYGLSIILTLLTLLAVFAMFFQLKGNSDLVKDCVSVEGSCRQQRLLDTATGNLEVICNQEKIITLFSYKLNDSYKPIADCIPFIENALNVDIPEDGVIIPGSLGPSSGFNQ